MTYQKDKENAFSKRTSKMPYQKEQGKWLIKKDPASRLIGVYGAKAITADF